MTDSARYESIFESSMNNIF